MNKFRENLKVEKQEADKITDKYIAKEIDDQISANIAKMLFEMMNNSDDPNKRKQILNRMLNINKLFKEGFDKQMQKLEMYEKEEQSSI